MLTAADSLCCRLAFEQGSYFDEPYATLELAPSHAHMFGPAYPSSADPSVQLVKCKRCPFEREALPSERGENG